MAVKVVDRVTSSSVVRLFKVVEFNELRTLDERFCSPLVLRDCRIAVLRPIILSCEAVNDATEALERLVNASVERLAICVEESATN